MAWCRQTKSHYRSHCWPMSDQLYAIIVKSHEPRGVSNHRNSVVFLYLLQANRKEDIKAPHKWQFVKRNTSKWWTSNEHAHAMGSSWNANILFQNNPARYGLITTVNGVLIIHPAQRSWRGVYWLPSVDRIVSVLYLSQYSPNPFHINTSYQAT